MEDFHVIDFPIDSEKLCDICFSDVSLDVVHEDLSPSDVKPTMTALAALTTSLLTESA